MAQLFFKYGAMNSGKTIEILKVAHNYEEQNKPVLIFTSALDDRDKIGYVASRIGIKREAIPLYPETDMYERVLNEEQTPYCILVDESQFLLKEHVLQMAKIVDDLNIPVMAFGLKMILRIHSLKARSIYYFMPIILKKLKRFVGIAIRKRQ